MPENNVPLSEQAHWKNRDVQTSTKPAEMGMMGHAMLVLVVLGLGFGGLCGGLYGYQKYHDYMRGSKEMTLLEYHYWGATSPDTADTISFEVPRADVGLDGNSSTLVEIKVPRVFVFPRSDGKNITTVRFFYRTEMSPSYDKNWTYAWILVPDDEDRRVWELELARINRIYHEHVSAEDGKMKPKRVLPNFYREPEPLKKQDDSY